MSSDHLVGDFRCARNSDAVSYLRETLPALLEKNYGSAYVMPASEETLRVWGYYHLSGSLLKRGDVDNRDQKGLPRDTPVPVFAIAYIARCDSSPKGIGAALIIDAARRARSLFPTWGLTLYAKNAKLVTFYENLGFVVVRELRQMRTANGGLPENGPYCMYAPYNRLILPP